LRTTDKWLSTVIHGQECIWLLWMCPVIIVNLYNDRAIALKSDLSTCLSEPSSKRWKIGLCHTILKLLNREPIIIGESVCSCACQEKVYLCKSKPFSESINEHLSSVTVLMFFYFLVCI